MPNRLIGLPAIFQFFGSFSAGFSGTGSLDAASATLPNVVLRPPGPVMVLFSAFNCSTGTFHSFAAACSSIKRAAAPPWRTYSCDSRMPRLPPVENDCQARLRLTFSPGVGYS